MQSFKFSHFNPDKTRERILVEWHALQQGLYIYIPKESPTLHHLCLNYVLNLGSLVSPLNLRHICH